jgi:hypothetical protein
MEVDFDKQTDAILRDLARGNSFAEISQINHLDADELSAFAENALPAKARLRTMEHLADCSKCRKILTNINNLNAETESEIIHEAVKTVAVIPQIPWYSKLFAFPNLTYAMGALTLLLGGTIAFLVFQNSREENASVAQADKTYEKPTDIGGTSSEGDAPLNETYSANTSSANVATPAANRTANSTSPLAPVNPTASSPDVAGKPLATPATAADELKSAPKEAEKLSDQPKSEIMSKGGETVDSKKDADVVGRTDEAKPKTVTTEQVQTEVTDNNVSQRQVQELPNVSRNQSNIIMPDGQPRNMPAPSAPMKKAEPRRDDNEVRSNKTQGERAKESDKGSGFVVATKTVGSKTFQSLSGVWTDSVYKGGSTKNVRRTSDEYKKLDSGLQNIGNSFSGTVIVVWNGKNYKIQ